MTTLTPLWLSVSPHFRDKTNTAPLRPNKDGVMSNKWAYARFTNTQMTTEGIIAHVTAGKAICVSRFKSDHRHSDNFLSAQLMGIDFDHGPNVAALTMDVFVMEHAFLVYATPSSTPDAPRSRALFALDAPITDAAEYRRLILRLLARFDQQDADDACKDVARLFYGSTQPGYDRVASAVLPVAVLEALPPHPSEMPAAPAAPPAPRVTSTNGDRLKHYADVAVNRQLASLVGVTHHRNDALNKASFSLGQLVAAPWSGVDRFDAENALMQAAQANGYVAKDGESAARDTIKSGMTRGMATPLAEPRDRFSQNGHSNGSAPVVAKNAIADSVPPPAPPLTWKTSDDSMEAYRQSLRVAPDFGGVPLAFPYKALRESGGFCLVMPPGILMGVVGLSGGMKTSFVETITDRWRQMDPNHVLWWGPEWDWQRMGDRAVQRYGGPMMTDKLLHTMWLDEARRGVPSDKRYGKPLSDQQIDAADGVARSIEAWPGKSHFLEKMDVDIQDLLAACDRRLAEQRDAGTPIRVAVWDYVQLLNMRSVRSEMERITQVLGLLKDFVVDHKIIGVVSSQVTKASGAGVRDGSDTLDAEAGQFQRSDVFNLVLTLNPIYSGSLITSRGVIRVAKNSIGKPIEKTVQIDPSRFLWLDKVLPDARPQREPEPEQEVEF